eukprot:Em1038g1a
MSSELHVDQDFEKFKPWAYIKEYYGKLDCWHRNPLKYLHDFYTSHFQRGANLKVLNYGCGPIVAFEASAVPYAQVIVLADYAEQNRAVAKLWLDKDPSRPDFSALYRYVVEELEGQGAGEVEERQDAVRRLSTICGCDIYQDPLIEKGYEGPYDVIYTASCIEDACYTIEVFGAALSKLCDLLKPGGWLVMSMYGNRSRSLLDRALAVKMSSELHVDQDYEKFEPWAYIKEYYGKLDCWHRNPLKNLHDFYTSHFQRGANLKVLNYGCGPIVAFEASAVPYAQEIVLAEYAEQNRAVAKLRLDKDPSRPDFSALYRYVVEELEGQGAGEVEERQDAVMKVHTIVYSGACIEDACYTIEVFGAALSKLCDLLKPGGCLVMSVCTGTEAGTLNMNYVDSIRYVELKVDPMRAMQSQEFTQTEI